MMRVQVVRAWYENFLGFRERVEVPMAGLGLVMVRGENRVSSAADSNGAGKSALVVDGPAFALFGETLRGLRGDAVACRHTKGQAVAGVELTVGEERLRIVRTARPTSLAVEWKLRPTNRDLGVKELQAEIESALGFGLRTYRNAVVFGQGSFDRFSQADQADQLRMLDEIQGLDFRTARERAKQWADGARADAGAWEQRLVQVDAQIRTADQQLAQFAGARAKFDSDKQGRQRAAEDRVARAADADRDAARLLEAVREARSRLPHLRRAALARSEAQVAVDAGRTRVRDCEREYDVALAASRDLVVRVNDLLSGSTCPTCLAKFDEVEVKRVRAAFDPELEAMNIAAAGCSVKVAAAARELELAEKVLASHDAVDARALAQLEGAASDAALSAAQRAVTLAAHAAADAEQDLARLDDEVWSGADVAAKVRADREAMASSCAENERALTRSRVTLSVAEYWLEAFGDRGIRSMLFDSVAGFVNDRLAHHLSQLAAGEVAVALSALTALKGGGSRERVSVASEWAWGGAGRGTGSAGQDRRVDLALFAALQDLAESRSARPFPFKAWDEPGDALDAKGQELFARWVEREARARGTGFLVTHSQSLADAVRADRTWTIIMTRDGASVRLS